MSAYLFVWNPGKWNWTTLEQKIEELQNSGKTIERWSCKSHRTIKSGDRAFLARVGAEPKGVFGAGYVASAPFLTQHWSGEDKEVYRVIIDFEVLLNPDKEPILTTDMLKIGSLSQQLWTPQSSGISIRNELIDELEAVWFDFLTTQEIRFNPYAPAEEQTGKTFTEGASVPVLQTRYERNPFAREQCLKHFGYQCSVCEFDFAGYYGQIGKDFIHVHHLTPIATVKTTYLVDPIRDLRPVCPNCHAMLHKRVPALTIDELKTMIKRT
jgi:5-methylcytosine-specific restriction enzyme A